MTKNLHEEGWGWAKHGPPSCNSVTINLELFHSNCRLLDKNTSNDDDDGNDDKEKQEVHYTNGPFLITDMTDFMQQT